MGATRWISVDGVRFVGRSRCFPKFGPWAVRSCWISVSDGVMSFSVLNAKSVSKQMSSGGPVCASPSPCKANNLPVIGDAEPVCAVP